MILLHAKQTTDSHVTSQVVCFLDNYGKYYKL